MSTIMHPRLDPDDPIRLTTKASNNRLKSIREESGMSPKEMAASIGISYYTYLQLESLKRYPSEKMARKVATALGFNVDYVFPGYLRKIAKTVAIKTIPEAELLSLSEPEVLLLSDRTQFEDISDRNDLATTLMAAVGTLTPREEKVINMRYGLNGETEKTLDELSAVFSASRERIRQIEAKALRKLRHPSRARILRPYLNDDEKVGKRHEGERRRHEYIERQLQHEQEEAKRGAPIIWVDPRSHPERKYEKKKREYDPEYSRVSNEAFLNWINQKLQSDMIKVNDGTARASDFVIIKRRFAAAKLLMEMLALNPAHPFDEISDTYWKTMHSKEND